MTRYYNSMEMIFIIENHIKQINTILNHTLKSAKLFDMNGELFTNHLFQLLDKMREIAPNPLYFH